MYRSAGFSGTKNAEKGSEQIIRTNVFLCKKPSVRPTNVQHFSLIPAGKKTERRIAYAYMYTPLSPLPPFPPQWGTADAEINLPSVENQELTKLMFSLKSLE